MDSKCKLNVYCSSADGTKILCNYFINAHILNIMDDLGEFFVFFRSLFLQTLHRTGMLAHTLFSDLVCLTCTGHFSSALFLYISSSTDLLQHIAGPRNLSWDSCSLHSSLSLAVYTVSCISSPCFSPRARCAHSEALALAPLPCS